MSDGYQIVLFLTLGMILGFLAIITWLGQPPKHCRYFVPVRHHPGIYSCSEHPRPVNAR